MSGFIAYHKVTKYLIKAVCREPLHIGNAIGNKEEVLVHPIDRIPFIQSSSIVGVLRDCCNQIEKEKSDILFGKQSFENKNQMEYTGSIVRITDGHFTNNVLMELRPHLKINEETGTCSTKTLKGNGGKSGQKFNIEYIGAGAEFEFAIYLFDTKYQSVIENIIGLINDKQVQFGGKKSNGCGFVEIKELKRIVFDLDNKEGRDLWIDEDKISENHYENIDLKTCEISQNNFAYELMVEGKTEGDLLVKGVGVKGSESKQPDAVNMKNARDKFIVPGSSLKGAIRSQMTKIASYLEQPEIINDTFGESGEVGKLGNIIFSDTEIVQEQEANIKSVRYRIHIDKFTGGVMQRGLFSEENVSGKVNLHIAIRKKNEYKKSCALLLFALRDLAIGTMSIGSGYNIGKGIIAVSKIKIFDKINGKQAIIDFDNNTVTDETQIIEECMKSISSND